MSATALARVRLRLLGEFDAQPGREEMPLPARRLLAFLAIRRRPERRDAVATALWPDQPETVARGRLREAAYRARVAIPGIVESERGALAIGADVAVDLDASRALCASILHGHDGRAPEQLDLLAEDVLVGWDEPWLTEERLAHAGTRVRALERAAQLYLADGDYDSAEHACRLAAIADPMRESAHVLLAQVYLQEGNPGPALRVLADFQRHVKVELGVPPGRRLLELRRSICAATA